LRYKLEQFGAPTDDAFRRRVMEAIVQRENEGYQYEAADASLKLLVLSLMGREPRFIERAGYRSIIEKRPEDAIATGEATVRITVEGQERFIGSMGHGPVDALYQAHVEALRARYPQIGKLRLNDYKVRVINARESTASKVLVFVESEDLRDHEIWGTVGVSENIIEASWIALLDSINYLLLKDAEQADRRQAEGASPNAP
jgi:2-isopropylmalate synthase